MNEGTTNESSGLECHVVQGAASDYLEGDLTSDEETAYLAHLQACDECHAHLGSMTQLIEALSELRFSEASTKAEKRYLSLYNSYNQGDGGSGSSLHDLRRLWTELQEIPNGQRSDFLSRHDRYRSRTLCEWLAAQSRNECQSNTAFALELVEAAILIARQLPRTGATSNLLAECWSTKAVCRLALMDLVKAERELEVAERHFANADKTQITKARLLMVQASLFSTLGQTDRALSRYEECLRLFEELGERTAAISMRINIGSAYLRSGELERAQRIFEDVLPQIMEKDAPTLAFGALLNLAITYCELKKGANAERLVPRLVALDRQLPSSRKIHLKWLSGSIARAKQDWGRALSLFNEVRSVFRETGEWIHYVESSLDIARIHIQQGEWLALPLLLHETRLCAKSMCADENCLQALRLLREKVSGHVVEESSLRALALLLGSRVAWRDASF